MTKVNNSTTKYFLSVRNKMATHEVILWFYADCLFVKWFCWILPLLSKKTNKAPPPPPSPKLNAMTCPWLWTTYQQQQQTKNKNSMAFLCMLNYILTSVTLQLFHDLYQPWYMQPVLACFRYESSCLCEKRKKGEKKEKKKENILTAVWQVSAAIQLQPLQMTSKMPTEKFYVQHNKRKETTRHKNMFSNFAHLNFCLFKTFKLVHAII